MKVKDLLKVLNDVNIKFREYYKGEDIPAGVMVGTIGQIWAYMDSALYNDKVKDSRVIYLGYDGPGEVTIYVDTE